MVSTETKAVLRIISSSLALYFNVKFFYGKDGPSDQYRKYERTTFLFLFLFLFLVEFSKIVH